MEPPPRRGVLLYYCYTDLEEAARSDAADFLRQLGTRLDLVGRCRVALDGINVTVGGTLAALEEHIAAVQAHVVFGALEIDFKLAPMADGQAGAAQVVEETGFSSLSVREHRELVTLGQRGAGDAAPLHRAAAHVTPTEWHALIEAAARPGGPPTVILDARNVYETRVGRFAPPGPVEFIDPCLRSFSAFPAWVDDNLCRLRGKRVLMYCTGGVRCERASAYVRGKGAGFGDVYQLRGGIQRYLEAYPQGGGHFRGKNFVFDPRCAVGPESGGEVAAACMGCGVAHDDYGGVGSGPPLEPPSPRTRCPSCRMLVLACPACARGAAADPAGSSIPCEVCRAEACPAPASPQRCGGGGQVGRGTRLKVLCLHGFRQSASSLVGRTHGLRRKLRGVVDLVMVDGPHIIPSRHLPGGDGTAAGGGSDPRRSGRRAWLFKPGEAEEDSAATGGGGGQHPRQTEGWPESLALLQQVLRVQGPFDGVLGFSQGAAAASALAALQSLHDAGRPGGVNLGLRFCVLASGFPSPAPEHVGDAGLYAQAAPVALPSLHVYGASGNDRQIGSGERHALPWIRSRLLTPWTPAWRGRIAGVTEDGHSRVGGGGGAQRGPGGSLRPGDARGRAARRGSHSAYRPNLRGTLRTLAVAVPGAAQRHKGSATDHWRSQRREEAGWRWWWIPRCKLNRAANVAQKPFSARKTAKVTWDLGPFFDRIAD